MPSPSDRVFAALADPTRRALYQRLAQEGELTVVELTGAAGISQPAVSKHLALLKRAGLVRDRREGRNTHYRTRQDGLAPLIDWLSVYSKFWRERLDDLQHLLDRLDS